MFIGHPNYFSYLNIPIWFTTWLQFPGVCNSSVNRRYSSLRISIIRPAMVRISRFHSSNSPTSLRISDTCQLCQLPHFATYVRLLTRRAPCDGGLLISLRCNTDTWLLTRFPVSLSLDTTCSAPTRSPYNPAFFAKLFNPCHSSRSHLMTTSICSPDIPTSAILAPQNIAQPTHPCLGHRSQNLGKRSRRTSSAFSRPSPPQ